MRSRTFIIHIVRQTTSALQITYECDEAVHLAHALGLECVHDQIIRLRQVRAGYLFGSGKVDQIKAAIAFYKIDLVLLNTLELTPVQQRNLERIWQVKVIDRTGLILEIFSQRAHTKAGRLQVELARLDYEYSRLIRTWTHLERQRGGRGFLAGPGERQLESDRRNLSAKISVIKSKLAQVRRTRGLHRQKRKHAPQPVVALVGYTNAGKSSLFNQLTDSQVLAKDMVFTTLDTVHRRFFLPDRKPAWLSDTVGFITDLPTHLIAAFEATLEELREADLLVLVRDIADPLSEKRRETVLEVLHGLEVGSDYDQPLIEVWNKSDLLSAQDALVHARRAQSQVDNPPAYLISCQNGQGIEALKTGMMTILHAHYSVFELDVDMHNYAARAWLHEYALILGEQPNEVGVYHMRVRLSEVNRGKFQSRFPNLTVR